MALKIRQVHQGSIAEKYGISPRDIIISINGNNIDDFLDLQFHTSEPRLAILLKDDADNDRMVTIDNYWVGKLGIEPVQHKIKRCHNKCLFCFIDQMPLNLRPPLYVKDDDYIYSFIFGNYISLNNISEVEFKRIIEQRISPLYISVHTTDINLRAHIMGYKHTFKILDHLQKLAKQGISYHTQIVLIPDFNDGKALEKTLTDLINPDLNTLSVGIVPVGLTKHRDNLTYLTPYSPAGANEVIKLVNNFCTDNKANTIYIADEFFILAGQTIPNDDYYNDYCQIENGIGMIRATSDNFRRRRRAFIQQLHGKSVLFVTGVLATEMITGFASYLNKSTKSDRFRVLGVKNRFFGESVTVSGLLTFTDIEAELSNIQKLPDVLAFSKNMFNTDGYTLDNVHYNRFKQKFGRSLLIVDELWNDWDYSDNSIM